jgi:hypothetical protein
MKNNLTDMMPHVIEVSDEFSEGNDDYSDHGESEVVDEWEREMR